MVKSKTPLHPIGFAAGQQINKYYTHHPEDRGKTNIEGSTDGYTLYRALASQVIGFPFRFQDIRNAVLQFYLRVYANERHPLHDELRRHEAAARANRDRRYELFALLDCPDLEPNEHVLWIVAYALKLRIDFFESISRDGEPRGLIHSVGPQDRPISTLVRRENRRATFDRDEIIGTPFYFEALLPDESGKALIQYLDSQRTEARTDPSALQIRQMSWAWVQSRDRASWTCFNEFRPESKVEDLEYDDVRDRMDTFAVVVNESRHVLPALELFREALRRAPNQRRWVRHSQNQEAGFMLPHCSVDAEFVKMERDMAEECARTYDPSPKDAVHEGLLEELCSVLTFAVGRHFFLVFNLVHLLETSDKLTVPALTTLFRETIFNKDLLKLWWNPQSADIAVLDGTIAHMFQETERDTYIHVPFRGEREIEIVPQWRIKRNHFQNVRPDDLKFPTEYEECDLHRMGGNEQGITCCCRLGNIDIAALLTHFCWMHGMDSQVKKAPWTEVRFRFRYGDLLERMLGSDRLYPILNHMKDRAGKTGKSRDAFYQDMGLPGMECEDDVMAYNIGDVAGQNMIFEQLLALDDWDFVAGCLSQFGGNSMLGDDRRRISQRKSVLGTVAGIQLWEDNPRGFEERDLDGGAFGHCRPREQLHVTASLMPWEHNRRVELMRKKEPIVLKESESHPSGAYVLPLSAYATADEAKKDISGAMHDPARLWVPSECVQKVSAVYDDPVVRAGTTHTETLVEVLNSRITTKSVLPPAGFGAEPGNTTGLPEWLKRIPGAGLDQARKLFDAFQQPNQQAGSLLGSPQNLTSTTGWIMHSTPDSQTLRDEAATAQQDNGWVVHDGDRWKMAHYAFFDAERALEREEEMTAEQGPPYSLDLRDFFDLEGREYGRRVKKAKAWNRPPFEPKVTVDEDGGQVKSLAAMQVEVLRETVEQNEGFEEVVGKKRKNRGW